MNMSDFWIYTEIGLKHVLNLKSYDHVLFLMALSASNSFKEWKKMLLLVTVFTVGHSIALVLSIFNIVMIQLSLVELLIPITILFAAGFNFFASIKSAKIGTGNAVILTTLFFGVIHGLGFATYFKSILPGTASEKAVPLLEFAIGIEGAQLIIVLGVLLLSFAVQNFFRVSKRDFTLVVSAFIIGMALPMILENTIWN